jgi:predicted acylesterase/phospholipase RssA
MWMVLALSLLGALWKAAAYLVGAREREPHAAPHPPVEAREREPRAGPPLRVGFVIGGGSRMVAFAARLARRLMEDSPRPLSVQFVHGTSSGAILAPYLAAGRVEELETTIREEPLGVPWPGGGWPGVGPLVRIVTALAGWGAYRALNTAPLERMLGSLSRTELARVGRVVTATTYNLDRNRVEVHRNFATLSAAGRASMLAAIRASSAFAAGFHHVLIRGERHGDGGLTELIPCTAIQQERAKVDLVVIIGYDNFAPSFSGSLLSQLDDAVGAAALTEQREDLVEIRALLSARGQRFVEAISPLTISLENPTPNEYAAAERAAEVAAAGMLRSGAFRGALAARAGARA